MLSVYLNEVVNRRQRILSRSIAWIAALSLCTALQVLAQVSTANVAAVIEDAAGARISDASVTLTNTLTGAESISTSNHQGLFALPGLLPGTYSLEIARVGFSTVQFTGLVLNVGDNKSFVVRMRVGAVTETITIDASGLVPNSADASVSTVVDQTFVANVPLNGRSFQDLISMTPGVATQSPQASAAGYGPHGDFSVNGQRPDRNSYMIDGISADLGVGLSIGHQKFASSGTAAATTALGTTQSLVSIDGLQEFRVLTANYSAEYGRNPGGQFTLLTRSGTDAYHGSLYDYVRHYYLNSVDWYERTYSTRAHNPYQQHDFGGTLGGPLRIAKLDHGHSRSFVFLSYEGVHVAEPIAPFVLFAPTIQTVQSVPTQLKNLLIMFPGKSGMATNLVPASTGMFSIVDLSPPQSGSIQAASLRIDHTFSPRLSMFFRYADTPSRVVDSIQSFYTARHGDTKNITLGATHRLSSVKTNEIRIGYGVSNSHLWSYISPDPTYKPYADFAADMGIANSSGVSTDLFLHAVGAGDAELKTDGATGSVSQWNVRDTLSVQKSHHLLQFGMDERYLVSKVNPSALTVEADFFSMQNVLANSASSLSITNTLPASPRLQQFAAFVQDEWQASKSLTVSAGLRWDVAPAPKGSHGADAYTVLGDVSSPASMTLAPRGTPLWKTGWLNFAPRVGATWLANSHASHELVIRAGGGIYFDSSNSVASPAFSALGFSTTKHFSSVPLPITTSQLDFSSSVVASATQSLVYVFPRHLQLPYTLQWNAAIEQALGRNQIVTATYIGSSGRRLLQPRRSDISAQNPAFGEVVTFASGITSSYQALQLKFQRSMAHGIQALTSYTWAHAIDEGSPDAAWTLSRANSDYDLRHHLDAAFSWSQHDSECKRNCSWLLVGWGADARVTVRGGFPITPLGNLYSDPATGNRYFSGVDLVPGRPLYLYGSQYPGGRMLNGGSSAASPAFVLPTMGSAGNAPRNLVRGFGDYQANLAIRREVHLPRNMRLQVRAEGYNIFNHPNLGYFDPSITDAQFGRATMMLNQSFGPSGSLYQPGGSRSLQLSLRVHF